MYKLVCTVTCSVDVQCIKHSFLVGAGKLVAADTFGRTLSMSHVAPAFVETLEPVERAAAYERYPRTRSCL